MGKLKFFRNIIICVIALVITAFILNYTPGYKREQNIGITKLVIVEKDVTEDLKNLIYRTTDGTIYISKADMEQNFGIKENIQNFEIEKNGIEYLPISEMEDIYNIKIDYKENTDIVIIDMFNQDLIIGEVTEETEIKYKQRNLSKTVSNIEAGEKVYCFYTTSRGWTQIRTEEGITGYIREEKIKK